MRATVLAVLVLAAPAAAADSSARDFAVLCAACHGGNGAGGERGPSLHRRHSAAELQEIIRRGIPSRGMPAFNLPEAKLEGIARFVHSLSARAADNPVDGDVAAGRDFFFGEGGCAACHIVGGRGGASGPDLSHIAAERTLPEIEEALRTPGARIAAGYAAVEIRTRHGSRIDGIAKNESTFDVQVQDSSGRVHAIKRSDIAAIERKGSAMPPLRASEAQTRNLLAFLTRVHEPSARPAAGATSPRDFDPIVHPRPGEWPTYNGVLGGNRHSSLRQIHTGNVGALAPRWMFPVPESRKLEVTPVVIDGVMYVTTVNQVYALDPANGRELWHFRRPRTRGLVGDASGGINRGVAVLGNRVFLVTDNARLLALDRRNGALLWDVQIADWRLNYGATGAPLVVKDLVITGTSGGDEGVRGLIAAFRADTGERVWQFWTVPLPGEPGSETWQGKAIEHGCSTAWLTGTYDTESNVLYWTTGNPCPDYNGDERRGDNLWANSVVALDAATGKLRWHYQFTPHDLHDWDAVQPPVLIDAPFEGRARKLLVQANRNGFFYVLDRTDGRFLLAKPFAKQTWSDGIGPDGRPRVRPGTAPTVAGTTVCPSVEGATNWMSTAFNPETGLFYVMAMDKCSVYTKSDAVWKAGESFYGGDTRNVPGEPGRKVLRAIKVETGEIAWELPQVGSAQSWGGLLSTAGGLLFYCDDGGAFAAVDARTGKPLWHFHTSELWKASPMTYTAGGKQFVAVAAGSNVLAFALE